MFHSKFLVFYLVHSIFFFCCIFDLLNWFIVSYLMYLMLNCLVRLQNVVILHFPYLGKSRATKSKIYSRLKFFLTQVSRKPFSFSPFFQSILFSAILFQIWFHEATRQFTSRKSLGLNFLTKKGLVCIKVNVFIQKNMYMWNGLFPDKFLFLSYVRTRMLLSCLDLLENFRLQSLS